MAFQDLNNSFSDIAVENRINLVDSFLKEINSLIDFKKLKSILNKNNIGNKSTCGVRAYDNILMFKIKGSGNNLPLIS